MESYIPKLIVSGYNAASEAIPSHSHYGEALIPSKCSLPGSPGKKLPVLLMDSPDKSVYHHSIDKNKQSEMTIRAVSFKRH